jgi:hypothetical protein
VDAAAIAVVHAGVCVVARIGGFDHVSDDDFARVTIAQAFAHAPKLDPSGTSWLPFPFWILGTLMLAFGRSLAAARVLSVGLASAALAAPYAALRLVDVPRRRALFAMAFAYATPWAIWLGAGTVPESMTASLAAAAVIACTSISTSTSTIFGVAMLAACLSRYEPWPMAAILTMAAVRGRRWGIVALCAAAPVLWMAWNAHAHDGPLHFFRRVSTFKRAIGEGTTDTLDAVILYPRLLLARRPEVTLPALVLLRELRDPQVRRRWGLPLVAVAAQIVFLVYGNVRDGAPAHHPERALFGAFVVLAMFVADVGLEKLRALATRKFRLVQLVLASVLALWATSVVRGPEIPGRSPSEDRTAQLRRGEELRSRDPSAIVVTPCAFEHFALLAAFGRPERATIQPRTGAPVDGSCPAVEIR